MAIKKININALTIQEMAELLKKAGGIDITPGDIARDFDSGVPLNDDGTVSLCTYVAWLLSQG